MEIGSTAPSQNTKNSKKPNKPVGIYLSRIYPTNIFIGVYIDLDKKEKFKYLKKRIDIVCNSKNKKHKNQELKCRARYGTCCCDTYSLDYTLGLVISNYLYQYLADAKQVIERDDWDKIEQCAENIRNYAKTDPWERLLDETKEEFKEKRKLFKESLDWLYENWNTLWW